MESITITLSPFWIGAAAGFVVSAVLHWAFIGLMIWLGNRKKKPVIATLRGRAGMN